MKKCEKITIPFLKEKASLITYENGYTFVYVPKKGDVFNINTWVKTGSIHEDDKTNGVSHFLEHLMFKGTERFKPGEFDRKMESMGAIINAATWKDFTFYYITGPKGLDDEYFNTALDMHADMLLFSTIPEEEVGPQYDPDDPGYAGEKRERSVVIEEIGMRQDSPWNKVYNAVNHIMYPDTHPYQRDVIGTRQIIGNIPQNQIISYYRTWYTPQNMVTVIVGDFDEAALEEKVMQSFDFSRLPNGYPEKQALTQAPESHLEGSGKSTTLQGNYTTSFFIMGFHGPATDNLKESIALDIASYALGEGRSSRLTQALLEKPAVPVFNAVSCGQSGFRLGNTFYIQGNFNGAVELLDQVKAEVNRFLTESPITQDEFDRAVKKLKVDFAETSETAAGIAEAIGESMTVSCNIEAYTRYLDILKSLDVKTVRDAAQRYINLAQMYTSILVPENAPNEATVH